MLASATPLPWQPRHRRDRQPASLQGQYVDAETGLRYNRHRCYDPGTRRFLAPAALKLSARLNNCQSTRNPYEMGGCVGV
ncbi:RHS repeat-associated core domain-containing protein [Pseudomonas viridiflava]|uniref:RHS repeat-associated core domain-containing protein n=1 Tax=Pseudomonas viridiflava TaxID=33069 RepID=UPI001C2CD01C|nr:hypothetical protein [Pseudomonas viridiflava]